jgi:lipopolysaccharide biosynthesis glycosyltransferase
VFGFLFTLASIIKNSNGFNHDIIIFDWGNLSYKHKIIIKELYENVKFREIDISLYQKHHYDETWRTWTYNCNYRFDIFLLDEYDRVIFFDSDILFEIDINEILKYDLDFCAIGIPEYKTCVQHDTKTPFNGGLLSIGKKYLNEQTRKGLIEIAERVPPKNKNQLVDKWISDEPILNNYFNNDTNLIPKTFNYFVEYIENKEDFNFKRNYHFIGHNKPWYGNTLDEKFNQFTIDVLKTKGISEKEIKSILNKILLKCQDVYQFLLNDKNIDIYKFCNTIKPDNKKLIYD